MANVLRPFVELYTSATIFKGAPLPMRTMHVCRSPKHPVDLARGEGNSSRAELNVVSRRRGLHF